MSDKWKGRDQPDINHLTSLFSDNIMSAFVSGHLIIETLLVQMIDRMIGTTQSVISRLEDADYEGHLLSMLSCVAQALDRE